MQHWIKAVFLFYDKVPQTDSHLLICQDTAHLLVVWRCAQKDIRVGIIEIDVVYHRDTANARHQEARMIAVMRQT